MGSCILYSKHRCDRFSMCPCFTRYAPVRNRVRPLPKSENSSTPCLKSQFIFHFILVGGERGPRGPCLCSPTVHTTGTFLQIRSSDSVCQALISLVSAVHPRVRLYIMATTDRAVSSSLSYRIISLFVPSHCRFCAPWMGLFPRSLLPVSSSCPHTELWFPVMPHEYSAHAVVAQSLLTRCCDLVRGQHD